MTVTDHSKPVSDLSQVKNTKEPRITIIRTPHDDTRPYFSMSRNTAQDRSLSWEARGVLAYLLSKPSDWQIIIADLKQNCGRDKVRKILDELKTAHYLLITQGHDEKGHFTAEYQLHETPFTEKPSTVDQYTVKPETVKHPLHKIDTQKTENKKTSRQPDAIFDAISKVWKTTAGAIIGNMKSMMLGTAKTGDWAAANFDQPVTADEIIAFGQWYKRKNPDLTIPNKPEKIQRWFYEYRQVSAKRIVQLDPVNDLNTPLEFDPPLTAYLKAASNE